MENSLPENWTEVQLEECLISLESGSRPKGGVRGISEGIPSIGGEHLNDNGGFDFSNIKYVPVKFASRMNRGQIKSGDVLIVKDGATTGKTSYVNETFPHPKAVVNEHVFICRANSGINSKYLFYFLWSKEGKEKILENFKGSAQGGINTGFISNLLVPIAPKPEQDRIVAKLDAIMQKVEANKKRLEKIPKLLKRFRQAVLAAAVSGRLTEEWREENGVVEDWEELTLIDVINDKPKNGYSAKPVNYETPLKVLTLTATTSGKFIDGHFKYFDEKIESNSKFWIQPNDILVQRGNTLEYVGVSAVYTGKPNEYIYPDLMMRFRANDKIHTSLLYYMLSAEKSRNFLRDKATGTAGNMPKINQPTLMSLPINLPSPEEQKEILDRLEHLFAFADKIETRYLKAKAMLDRLPPSILAKAFQGELVEQDPSDEPASVLLKRIKTETTKLASMPKARKQEKRMEVEPSSRPRKRTKAKSSKA